MSFVEKTCSYCHKISWDSDFGSYYERHTNKETGKSEPCDTNGTEYKSSGPDPLEG